VDGVKAEDAGTIREYNTSPPKNYGLTPENRGKEGFEAGIQVRLEDALTITSVLAA
jgi:hypothetical protein